ncbi:hypothetical protein CEXT_701441 [Caerostris extrusa]|uniref:Uncharacterized protein n=1 Tax=Caerostris extrusa TaxID=172846 RepID=A0AAV4QUT0_CAEEX|nr:hypothetical protein CEXT_701441 [Caerostris extrusa]
MNLSAVGKKMKMIVKEKSSYFTPRDLFSLRMQASKRFETEFSNHLLINSRNLDDDEEISQALKIVKEFFSNVENPGKSFKNCFIIWQDLCVENVICDIAYEKTRCKI